LQKREKKLENLQIECHSFTLSVAIERQAKAIYIFGANGTVMGEALTFVVVLVLIVDCIRPAFSGMSSRSV